MRLETTQRADLAVRRCDADGGWGLTAEPILFGLHLMWVRRSPVPPPEVLGLRQMALGLALVAVTAIGVGSA